MNGSLVEATGAHAALRGAKTIVLSSYTRDSTLVATPVSLAREGERLFFRSHQERDCGRRCGGGRSGADISPAAIP